MQATSLNPLAIRKIGLRLFGAEKFASDPATVILDTIVWVDAVLGDAEAQAFSPPQDLEIRQLAALVEKRGLPAISVQLKVSTQTIRGWLHGTQPSPANIEKLKAFLAQEAESPLPVEAAGAEPMGSEVFGQHEMPELGS
jgi:hypothetical protein